MSDVKMQDVIDMIMEIAEDQSTSKNVKEKMKHVSEILKGDADDSIKKNQALSELDDVINENNLQQFTRTQLWGVVSSLEKVS